MPLPPPPLSQLSPLLSPHQWRLPLHAASLLRGFLCSLVSQVNTRMGQRRVRGVPLKTISHHFFFFFFNHLQSPDPARTTLHKILLPFDLSQNASHGVYRCYEGRLNLNLQTDAF